MRYIYPCPGWGWGTNYVCNYLMVASSATVESEWNSLMTRQPDHAQLAFELLSSTPYAYTPAKVHALRHPFKPFWQFEVTNQDVIYYTTTESVGGFGMTILVGVRKDIFTAPRLAKMLDTRRPAVDITFDYAMADLQLSVDEPLLVPEWAMGAQRVRRRGGPSGLGHPS